MKYTALGILLVLTITSGGCGVYSFSGAGKAPFSSIAVVQFENKTPEYQLADRLTDAVVDAFIRDNTVPVKDMSRAEAVLNGSVNGYRRDPYTYDQADVVKEYVVKVTIHVKVVKNGSEDVYWEEDFFAQGIYDANTETEDDGQTRAIDLLTSTILDRTTKSW
jgi:outer membrane lipopolysaccharide assembly protein LptE/RlpB